MEQLTQKKLCDIGSQQLEDALKENGNMEARWILMDILGQSSTSYLMNQHQKVSHEDQKTFLAYINRRIAGEPLQYILGTEEFMGMTFKVNSHVLIPRLDTEILIESILNEEIKKDGFFLDIGTGSGCILVSVLSHLKHAKGIGLDISEKALDVAAENSRSNNVNERTEFYKSDMLSYIKEENIGPFDVIISNPPYIPIGDKETLMTEVKDHEPHGALFGGDDGLVFYRIISEESPRYLKGGGYLFFEIGYDQGEQVKKMMEDNGFKSVKIIKDLAKLDRVVYGVMSGEV